MTITPIKKPKKLSLKKLIKEADKAIQEWGRRTYKTSFKGDVYSCLHHIVHKSQSTNLRWDKQNLIPVSAKEHFRIHSRNDIADQLDMAYWGRKVWGDNWETYIRRNKVKTLKPTRAYLEDIIKRLS